MQRIIIGFIIIASLLFTSVVAASEVLRPGDRIKLNFPVEEVFNDHFVIDREHKINLPEVGRLSVKGLSLEAAETLIIEELSKHYRNLETMTISLAERRIPISVLGFVNEPGLYELPEGGNLQMALSMAKGATAGAQLDRMQVRNQDRFVEFNYKAYLDTGDINLLPELQPLDTIFVPASPLIGNVQMEFDAATLSSGGDAGDENSAVKVFGEVINPGLFNFNQDQNIVDYLMRAGGVTRYAGVESIRIINQDEPINFNLKAYLDTGDKNLLPVITESTTIFVPVEEVGVKNGSRTVYVMGEVYNPGAYEIKDNTEFFDILANAGGPTRYSESRNIRIIRATGTVDKFDLQAYTEGITDSPAPIIKPGDAIFIPEKTDLNEKSWLKVSTDRAVRIIGAVQKPGRYEWAAEMTFFDIFAHAGGPNIDADLTNIRVIRDGDSHDGKSYNLEQFIQEGGDFSVLPEIQAGDTIVVSERTRDVIDNKARWLKQPQESTVYVFGQVGKPGRYAFKNNLHFLDIISAADGPSLQADIHNITLTHRNGDQAKVTKVDLGLYFQTGDETLLPKVTVGDTIYMPGSARRSRSGSLTCLSPCSAS